MSTKRWPQASKGNVVPTTERGARGHHRAVRAGPSQQCGARPGRRVASCGRGARADVGRPGPCPRGPRFREQSPKGGDSPPSPCHARAAVSGSALGDRVRPAWCQGGEAWEWGRSGGRGSCCGGLGQLPGRRLPQRGAGSRRLGRRRPPQGRLGGDGRTDARLSCATSGSVQGRAR